MSKSPTAFQLDQSAARPERVMLVTVLLDKDFTGSATERYQLFQAATAEAADLVKASGGDLIEVVECKRDKPHRALFIGTGKAEELAGMVAADQIDLVVFNRELSPMQERNLEKALQCRVLDRVGLILAIFARRAQSQEGRLQVELAQLIHLSSRLVRGYGHLQSQRGGIGLKGPGETQLETDRRLITYKITALKRRLQQLRQQRTVQRQSRRQSLISTFALIGYTNAGKSSLFNRLTKANVLAQDQLFATLDTTIRRLYLNDEISVLLSDTVGFVRDLPHSLVAAFAATLEETTMADCLIHVVDISHPDYERQIEDVNTVLKEIHADHLPQLMVYNKIDLLPQDQQYAGMLRNQHNQIEAVRLSVKNNIALDQLRLAITELAGVQQ